MTNSVPISGSNLHQNGELLNHYERIDNSKRTTPFDVLDTNGKSTLVLNHHSGAVISTFFLKFL
jgi:hypothetical protein